MTSFAAYMSMACCKPSKAYRQSIALPTAKLICKLVMTAYNEALNKASTAYNEALNKALTAYNEALFKASTAYF